MEGSPSRATTSSTAARTRSGDATSTSLAAAVWPAAWIESATRRTPGPPIAQAATRAPAPASRRDTASPIPDAAPVTMATASWTATSAGHELRLPGRPQQAGLLQDRAGLGDVGVGRIGQRG